MKEKLQKIKEEAIKKIEASDALAALNDVRVAVSEQDAGFGDETRVEIVTNKVEIPDANGTYKLDIEVKYKRYDEF